MPKCMEPKNSGIRLRKILGDQERPGVLEGIRTSAVCIQMVQAKHIFSTYEICFKNMCIMIPYQSGINALSVAFYII